MSITTAAGNPFKYLGPNLLCLTLNESHIYLLGGFLGGITAGYLYEFLFNDEKAINEREELVQKIEDELS